MLRVYQAGQDQQSLQKQKLGDKTEDKSMTRTAESTAVSQRLAPSQPTNHAEEDKTGKTRKQSPGVKRAQREPPVNAKKKSLKQTRKPLCFSIPTRRYNRKHTDK